MALTAQTNSTLHDIAQIFGADYNRTFALCGHVSPDGDCLGSQLALAHVLLALGKEVALLLVKDDPIDAKLKFLPGSEWFAPAMTVAGEKKVFDVFVALDVPMRSRIGEAACALLDNARDSVTIDHHAAPVAMTKHAYVDPGAASTTMLVWELSKLLMDKPPIEAALCAYTGLVTDTGCFQYQNTDANALRVAADLVERGVEPARVTREIMQNHSLASVKLEALAAARMKLMDCGRTALSWVTADDMRACAATKEDADGVVNMLRGIRGVRVACALREQNGEIRGNLRSKDETDVSVLAQQFGGGGHAGAAGFSLDCSMEEAIDKVSALLSALFVDEKDAC